MRHTPRTMIAGALVGAAMLGALVGVVLLATGCDTSDDYNVYVAPDTTYAYVEPAQVNCLLTPRGSPSWLYWCDDAGARLAYIYTHPAPASYHSSSIKTYVIHHYAPAPTSSTTASSSSWRVSMPDRKPAQAPAGASAFSNRSGGSSSWFGGGSASSYSNRSKSGSGGSSSGSSRGASSYSNRSSSSSRSSGGKRP